MCSLAYEATTPHLTSTISIYVALTPPTMSKTQITTSISELQIMTTNTPTTPFVFPKHYSFPPFFTLQPNLTTRHSQLQKWSSLVLAYARAHRLFRLALSSALTSPLFHNSAISKRLSREDAKEVVEYMVREGRAEWVGESHHSGTAKGGGAKGGEGGSVFWVWWRDVEEWAGLIGDWVDETAQKNTVLTLYELTESEATISQDFHGMDPDLLQRALGVLVKRGKAQVFGQEHQQGVKFF